jgi:hypothetical protein
MSYPNQPPVSGSPYSAPPPGQPYGYAPQPPKRKKWPWIVGGIVVFGLLACAGVAALVIGGTGAAVKGLDDNQKGQNAVAGQLGKATTDGKFEFTVTGMKCGAASVGPDGFGQKAQGQFCLVDVRIKNVGKTAEVFVDSSQKGYDAKGVEYSVDSGAGIYANQEYSTFLESINPGNSVHGKLVFDVPTETELTSVVLHESLFTAGIRVPLK